MSAKWGTQNKTNVPSEATKMVEESGTQDFETVVVGQQATQSHPKDTKDALKQGNVTTPQNMWYHTWWNIESWSNYGLIMRLNNN